MKKIYLFVLVSFLFATNLKSQDTFSILGFDSITGEVGGAGASCVDLFGTGFANDFIIDLFPGVGGIATQASYLTSNQANARSRMILGDSPTQIITWLQNNDVGGNPSVRQYGVVRMDTGFPKVAAHTGTNCLDYKNHIVGRNYCIQGNILLGQKVLDSMEVRFKREKGDLACKLMAAMQGANMVGADSRCAPNGSSSLFAFIKVMQPSDDFGLPSFLLSLKTRANAGIEPIDSLQKMFDAVKTCTYSTVGMRNKTSRGVSYFNVFTDNIKHELLLLTSSLKDFNYQVIDMLGKVMAQGAFQQERRIQTHTWPKGLYIVTIAGEKDAFSKKVLIE